VKRRPRIFDLLALAAALVALATLPSAAAAAGRAYELVSPAEKNGNDVSDERLSSLNFLPMVSPDGTRATYTSWNALPGSVANGLYNPFGATREQTEWRTEFLSPPMNAGLNINYTALVGFSEDLRRSVLISATEPTLTPEAAPGTSNVYLREADGSYRLVTPGAPPNDYFFSPKVVATSRDLDHIVLSIWGPGELTPDTPPGAPQVLYDWDAATGQLSLVGKEPNGSAFTESVEIAWPPGTSGYNYMRWNPVTADGSRILFTVRFAALNRLYQRVDGTSTTWISESQRTVPDPLGPKEAEFRYASTDGTRVFFSSAEKLTDDATTGPNDEGKDLYLYDTASGVLTDITVDGADEAGAQVQGVLGGAEDGSRLYFVAKGVLAPGATAGQDNLYVWTDDGSSAGSVEFVAAEVDSTNWKQAAIFFFNVPSRVTPDGSTLLFVADSSPTGYPDGGHYQGYVYDAEADQLVCATCNPSGATATTDALPVGTGEFVYPAAHPLTDDGRKVFFTSAERLAPGDDNAVHDTYEFDAETGEIVLISSGKAETPSEFTDASSDGSDVLFITRQQLVGIDRDQNIDVYDARIGGGLAGQNPSAAPPPCVGAECRGAVSGPPASTAPASSQLHGPGNAKPKHRKHKKHKRKHKKHKHGKKKQRKQGNRHGR
jgi:hypothetical protein